MTIRLNGSTSGYTEIDAPAVAGSNTLVLPTGNGSADQALVTNGSGTLSFADRGRMTLATAQNSTSGTSIDFTGIPSWVKRVTVMFNGVSTNGTSIVQVQIGSGSISASGYASTASYSNAAGAYTYATGGFILDSTNTALAAISRSGLLQLVLVGSNTWIASGNISGGSVGQVTNCCAGNSPALSGTLDRVRITTVNGTDTFDAGSINILYEG
jgi:hypothetical protein